ncbi:hypothetical protein KUV89_05275 [Marinobacter hydrocarbonoclasticus]|nr:hypothetical protein [Marinobacter nauticus]
MASLPASEAKDRARQDDKQWQPAPAKPKAQPAQSKPAAPAIDPAELARLKAENARLSAQLAEQGGDAEQVQRLRSELATSVEELAAMLEQNEQLKRRLDGLNNELALLQVALDEQQTLNQQLEQQMAPPAEAPAEAVQPDPVVVEPEPTPEPPSFWQGLAGTPWVLTLAAVVPALLLLLALFAWLRRRSDTESDELADESRGDAVMAEEALLDEEHNDGTLEPPQFDEVEPAAVQLDPEMEEEGQSLSDLLREQESGREEVDLDNHLMMDDDLDALLAEVDKQTEPSEPAEPAAQPQAPIAEAQPTPEPDFDDVFAQTLAEPAAQPEAVAEPELAPEVPQAAPQPAAMDEEPFIDIDKLLEESEGEVEVAYPGVRFDMDSSGEASEEADDESAVSAKLDLARAYIEIEDHDSARALLKEVAFDGNESQKAEANSLLEQL